MTNAGNADGIFSAEVHQAAGIVSVQLGFTPEEAIAVMQARARYGDLSLASVAAAVMRGEIRWDD